MTDSSDVMPSFTVMVREHAYTGQFYGEVVQAESYEKALRVAAEHAGMPQPPGPEPRQEPGTTVTERADSAPLANAAVDTERSEEIPQPGAAPQPPPGPEPRRGFNVTVTTVTEQASAAPVYSDVVVASSCEDALHIAAEKAAAPQPPPAAEALPAVAGRPRCTDVWVYSLLHCQLAAGHDPPHMAVAPGYLRTVRWVRDDRGVAHALAEQPVSPPATPSARQRG